MEQKFGPEEYDFYKAHLKLEGLGVAGQCKLKEAKVLLIGLGGLGSPCALYLASAGVGTLGLMDHDVVERSNLQRQILHSNLEVGFTKVISAKKRLTELNPNINLEIIERRLDIGNVKEILDEYDIIVDGSDNFETKYLLGDACFLLKKILITASVSQFEGQITMFSPSENSPCYRCLYPEPPVIKMQNCADAGAFSITPALLGTMQANEVLKAILGIGDTLESKVLLINPLYNTFKTFKLPKDSECPLCGNHPIIEEVKKIETREQVCRSIDSIEPTELSNWKDTGREYVLVDVREPFEVEIADLGGVHVPLNDLEQKIKELEQYKDKDVVVHCHYGVRSLDACRVFLENDFKKVKNLQGGIDKWSQEVDSNIQRY